MFSYILKSEMFNLVVFGFLKLPLLTVNFFSKYALSTLCTVDAGTDMGLGTIIMNYRYCKCEHESKISIVF